MKKIDSFSGEFEFLSNFYPSEIEFEGIKYPTNEHFFQAMKTFDVDMRENIAAAPTPGKAKRLGRHCLLRSNWEVVKENFMMTGLRLKFKNPELKEKLLATGNAILEEGNWWGDTYWGVCEGVGKNRLGILLMGLREELRTEDK